MWTNIKTKTRKLTAVLFIFVVALLFGAAISLQQSTAHAADAAPAEFKQVGASVRMGDKMGLRFVATIDKVDETSKYYVMIIPETWVTEYHLNDVGNEDYYKVLYDAGKRSEIDTQNQEEITMLVMQCEPTLQASGEYRGLYLIRGSIVDVKYENSNTKFFGVAFEQKADGTRIYADDQQEYSYRNITNVASAALNDAEAEYSEENIASLNKMVKDAYNVSIGKAENEQVDLPEISVNTNAYKYVAVQNGTTYQASVNNLPDIGIKVDWRLDNNALSSTIDENGKITVADEDVICKAYAKVLGNDISFSIYLAAETETGVLEDFSSPYTRYSFGSGGTVQDGQVPYTTTLADISGVSANGIAGRPIWRSAAVKDKDATFRFALSAEDLKAAVSEAENITVRMMVGTYYRAGNTFGDVTITAKNYDGDSAEKGYLKFVGRDFVVPHNTWVDLTVTKTEFLNFFEGTTETEKLNNFSVLGANNGNGIAGFTVCEQYTIQGYSADCEMLFDAIYTDKATVAPLESTAARMNIYLNGGSYLESYTDSTGAIQNDIVYVKENKNDGIKAKFGLTAEELSTITSLTFKVLMECSTAAENVTSYLFRYTRGGGNIPTGLVQTSVPCNQWKEITWTKEELCSKFLSNPANEYLQNEEKMAAAWTDFCNEFCSTGTFSKWFVSGVNPDNPPTIYIANVTFNYT